MLVEYQAEEIWIIIEIITNELFVENRPFSLIRMGFQDVISDINLYLAS